MFTWLVGPGTYHCRSGLNLQTAFCTVPLEKTTQTSTQGLICLDGVNAAFSWIKEENQPASLDTGYKQKTADRAEQKQREAEGESKVRKQRQRRKRTLCTLALAPP